MIRPPRRANATCRLLTTCRCPRIFRARSACSRCPIWSLFPHVLQPLHIFEPRYRQMLARLALADDQLICHGPDGAGLGTGLWWAAAHCTPWPAWAASSRIRHWKTVANLLLLGLRRVGIRQELSPERPYREAQVDVHLDRYAVAGALATTFFAQAAGGRALERILSKAAASPRTSGVPLLDSQIPLGVLTDVLASTIQLPCEFKQQMLAELDVDQPRRPAIETPGANPAEQAGPADRANANSRPMSA